MILYDYEGKRIAAARLSDIPLYVGGALVLVCCAMAMWAIFDSGRRYERDHREMQFSNGISFTGKTISISGMSTSYGDANVTANVAVGPLYDALTEAMSAWKTELGTLPIPRPELRVATWQACGQNAIACADREHNRITVITGDWDRAVLLHEYGHLLGVPHLEGDELMGPTHLSTLQKPTPLAVAVAKFMIKQKSSK